MPNPDELKNVSYEKSGPVAVVRFDDGKVNAQGPNFPKTLLSLLTRATTDKASALVIAGRAGCFSAGINIKMLPTLPPDELRAFAEQYTETLATLFTYPLPVVIGCTGHAVAGGAMILLCGDYKVGARGDFKIGTSEVPAGVPIPPIGAAIVRTSVPASLHNRALLHGELFDPEAALAGGFLDELVDEDEVIDRALANANRLAALPAHSYRASKSVVRGQVAEQAQKSGGAFLEMLGGG